MGTATERDRFLWSDVVNGFHGICPPRTSWILPCRARACCMSQTLVEGSTSKGGWRFELPISKSKETRTVCRVDKLPAPLFAGPFHVWGSAGGIGVLARSNFEAKSCSAKTIKDCSPCLCSDWVYICCTLHLPFRISNGSGSLQEAAGLQAN